MLRQLPVKRLTAGSVFDHVGVDYTGLVYLKYRHIRKPTICVFVSLSVKAVHLELASDLTANAFVTSLKRFIARRGKPHTLWSNHGTIFIGTARELKELKEFLEEQKIEGVISSFCSAQNIR